MADQTLDARGLNCPLPILKAKKTLVGMAPGDTLEVLATDPGSIADFAAFCRMTGHLLLESTCVDASYRYRIKKSGPR
ncbi:MAG: sulfurtransferase TusA family protein [Gammaproteobacteria bacterium]|nr:sulfurtransferase TusA family protein [Gammaproteobacteria bacterium]